MFLPHRSSLTVSPGHYVYINGSLVAARLAKPCDIVDTVTGPAKITAVGTEDTVGMYRGLPFLL